MPPGGAATFSEYPGAGGQRPPAYGDSRQAWRDPAFAGNTPGTPGGSAVLSAAERRNRSERSQVQLNQLLDIQDVDRMVFELRRLFSNDELDRRFLGVLAQRIEDANKNGAYDLANVLSVLQTAAVEELDERVQAAERRSRFERSREQLNKLLDIQGADGMISELRRLVLNDEIDSSFLHVLAERLEDAKRSGEYDGERVLSHLHTVAGEELEKRIPSAFGLLHMLMQLEDPVLRDRLLRQYFCPLVARTGLMSPSRREEEAKTQVTPAEFAQAVADTLDEMRNMQFDREAAASAIDASTMDRIQRVVAEASEVIGENYPYEVVDRFEYKLNQAFASVLWTP